MIFLGETGTFLGDFSMSKAKSFYELIRPILGLNLYGVGSFFRWSNFLRICKVLLFSLTACFRKKLIALNFTEREDGKFIGDLGYREFEFWNFWLYDSAVEFFNKLYLELEFFNDPNFCSKSRGLFNFGLEKLFAKNAFFNSENFRYSWIWDLTTWDRLFRLKFWPFRKSISRW